jgi:VCBS repeat-containing protein
VVGIVDSDVTILNPNGATLDFASVILTNARPGDTLAIVGALPNDINNNAMTASIDTSTPGQVIVSIGGTASTANYEQALRQVVFGSSSDDPGTTARDIAVTVGDSTETSNIAHATIAVTALNDAPVAQDGSAAGNEDTAITGNAVAVDPDSGDTLTYSLVGSNGGAQHGTVVLNTDGSFTYTPAANFNGSDRFAFKANDGTVDSNTASIALTVAPVNDAPVAQDGSAAGNEDTPITGNAVALDPNSGDTLTYSLVGSNGGAQHGTVALNADGSFTYTPAANFNGSDSFTFKANDGRVDSNAASVALTVAPVNDAPDDISGSLSVNEDSASGTFVGTVTGHDVDDTNLTYALTDNGGGRFAMDGAGHITVADGVLLDFEQAAAHLIVARVTDPGGLFFEKTLVVAVNDLNPETAIGDGRDNTLLGGFADDLISGAGGGDILRGAGGNDYIDSGDGNDTSLGDAGNDTVLGGSGNDYLNGGAGDDLVVGNDGADTVLGDTGNDYLDGGDGADLLFGGSGTDTVLGAGGDDYVNGGAGDDLVFGGDGADTLLGEDGNDYLNGENGNDIIFAHDGNDTVIGGDGDDYLSAGAGDDVLVGGNGNDTLFAGSGSDYLNGDAGDDRFIFDATFQTSLVIDFTPGAGPVGHDVIQFATATFANFADAMAHAVQDGTNTVFTDAGGHTLTLANVLKTSLVTEDFTFV